MNPKRLLTVHDSLAILDELGSGESPNPVPGKIPRSVYQYWDHSPPEQVQVLLERNRRLCELNGISYYLFTDELARRFLRSFCAPNVIYAYEMAPHPAMKSDVFRVAILAAYGGFYLDADMVFRDCLGDLFSLPGDLAIFRWNSHDRRNICSWLLGSTPGSPPIMFLRDAMAHSIIKACVRDPEAALRHSLAIAGPGVMTRGVASFLNYRKHNGHSDCESITIRSVGYAYQFLQNGPDYLNSQMHYKSTNRHWLIASRGGDTEKRNP